VDLARVSAFALLASGVAGVVVPDRVAQALDLTPGSPRGIAETRAGLGGTYAALGAYALLARSPAARRAVGATWLGAGVVRLAALRADRPRTDATYWAYLAAELGFGAAALGQRPPGRPARPGVGGGA
jgi:hypothetical protein